MLSWIFYKRYVLFFFKHLEWDKWVFDKVFNLQKMEVIYLLYPLKFIFKSILLFNFDLCCVYV